ncbi:AraC family transcriptional regulator, partial [Mycobacterium sp. ITM-2017-0098]
FTGLTPTDAAMARTLGAAERFLRDLLSTPEVADLSILLSAAGRMVASAVLAAFPNDLPLDSADDNPSDGHPALLEQAIDFIEHNAARDIGVGDIAAAV